MFETVAPQRFRKPDRKAWYEALPLSIACHLLAAGAVLVANVWEIEFPDVAPAQMIAFSIADTPPPPPPPPPPPKPVAVQLPLRRVVPQEIVAPTVIPEEIPEVQAEPVVAIPLSTEGVEGGVEGGIMEGEVGGVIGGTLGGVLVEAPKIDPVVETRVMVERDKPLPLYPLSQVYPSYPEDARLRSWEDQLVVRYVIGRDGRVKDVIVISPPQRDLFVGPTVKAIRSWRFRPLIKDGERKEVVHELTVFYRLTHNASRLIPVISHQSPQPKRAPLAASPPVAE